MDVVSISLGSINSATGVPCLNSFDVALLFAVSAGVVVVHAAGNSGPYPSTMNSYGPWVVSVGASLSDRSYENHVVTRNNQSFVGTGFSGNKSNLDSTSIHLVTISTSLSSWFVDC